MRGGPTAPLALANASRTAVDSWNWKLSKNTVDASAVGMDELAREGCGWECDGFGRGAGRSAEVFVVVVGSWSINLAFVSWMMGVMTMKAITSSKWWLVGMR